jgi:hypothetical protein
LNYGIKDFDGVLELLKLYKKAAGHHTEINLRQVLLILKHNFYYSFEKGAGFVILGSDNSQVCEGLKGINVILINLQGCR